MMLLTTMFGCLQPAAPPAAGCADCHGSAATSSPPEALGGVTDPFSRGVGAHESHFAPNDAFGPIACEECHAVPSAVDSPGHIDTSVPAEVGWSNGAIARLDDALPYDASAGTCTVYCHGVGLAGAAAPTRSWTDKGVSCGDCHGIAPPTPDHDGVSRDVDGCVDCHGGGLAEPERHSNGIVELGLGGTEPGSCAVGCHGTDETPAPPPDNAGNSDRGSPGVGAHEVHLAGGASRGSVPLACGDCHVVPADVGAAGHLDGDDRAEVVFAGLAAQGGPTYQQGSATCSGTYCHSARPGGDTPEPVWTDTGITCTACHGNPPPDPHPSSSSCTGCHPHQGNDAELHVDGVVE